MTGPSRPRAAIADLHPTQITVGLREVAQKRLRWRSRLRKAGRGAAPRVVAPVVRGPEGVLCLIDRHHLMRALEQEGVHEVLIRPIADFSALPTDEFWRTLDARGWCHPYDAQGRRRGFGDIPAAMSRLLDDPYRSLASALRRAGGYAKKTTPFSEFAWADFLRARVSHDLVEWNFGDDLNEVLILARTAAARDLPGWKPYPAMSVSPAPPASSGALG